MTRHFHPSGDAYFDRHDLGEGYVLDLFDDGSARVAGDGQRIDVPKDSLDRLRAIIREAEAEARDRKAGT